MLDDVSIGARTPPSYVDISDILTEFRCSQFAEDIVKEEDEEKALELARRYHMKNYWGDSDENDDDKKRIKIPEKTLNSMELVKSGKTEQFKGHTHDGKVGILKVSKKIDKKITYGDKILSGAKCWDLRKQVKDTKFHQ